MGVCGTDPSKLSWSEQSRVSGTHQFSVRSQRFEVWVKGIEVDDAVAQCDGRVFFLQNQRKELGLDTVAMAGVALRRSAAPCLQHAVRGGGAARTTKALRLGCLLQRRLALRLTTVALEELEHRHTPRKPKSIHGHGTHPLA